jgi:hypothetical protein
MGIVIEESDLDLSRFRCCGDEDLYPFGCPACGRLMVLCSECDTLYANLSDLADRSAEVNHFDPSQPIFDCLHCGHRFAYYFVRDGLYKVERERWLAAGFGHLLRDTSNAS